MTQIVIIRERTKARKKGHKVFISLRYRLCHPPIDLEPKCVVPLARYFSGTLFLHLFLAHWNDRSKFVGVSHCQRLSKVGYGHDHLGLYG